MERPAIITALLYTGVFLVPGFFLHRIATPETFVVLDDYHYGIVYGSALRMVLGHNPADLRMNYGLISTFSAAFLAKLFAIETFAGWIKLTQFFQIFFLFCAAISTWVLERNPACPIGCFCHGTICIDVELFDSYSKQHRLQISRFCAAAVGTCNIEEVRWIKWRLDRKFGVSRLHSMEYRDGSGMQLGAALLYFRQRNREPTNRSWRFLAYQPGFHRLGLFSCQHIYELSWRRRETKLIACSIGWLCWRRIQRPSL